MVYKGEDLLHKVLLSGKISKRESRVLDLESW